MIIYWFLPAIILLGIVTSYEDLKNNRIRNKWIVWALVYAIALYHFLYLFFRIYPLDITHFYSLLLNGILALFVGVLLWFLNVWTSGDAKLFFVYVLLVPPFFTLGSVHLYFHEMLINTFIPIALYLVFSAVEKTSLQEKLLSMKRVFSFKSLLTMVLLVFTLTWPVAYMLSLTGSPGFVIPIVLVIALFFQQKKSLSSGKIMNVLIFLSVLRLLFDNTLLTFQGWTQFFWLIIFFLLIRLFVLALPHGAFSKKIPVKEVKVGMIPAELIYKSKERYKSQKIPFGFMKFPKKHDYLFKPKPEGLSEEDVKKLKSIPHSKLDHVTVQETISFAPFLFAGALLQVFLHEDILSLTITLFNLF